tara:strand:- start:348 stop:476 length:129 start_codon:yes stop_codon:yes gene_type:complete
MIDKTLLIIIIAPIVIGAVLYLKDKREIKKQERLNAIKTKTN